MPRALPKRARFPEDSPELCITFFTCVGTGIAGVADLQTTYPAAVLYLEAQAVRYELVWLDNGSERDVLDDFVQRGAQLDKLLHNPTNQGLFHAANDAWFRGRGCRAPYVLSLEDDRVPRPGVAWRVPHLRHSLAILQAAGDGVLGVRLKHEWSDARIAKANPPRTPLWRTAPSGEAGAPPVRYTTHCFAPSSGFVWGSFTMAGVVYDRLRLLRRVGLFREGPPHDGMAYDYAEGQYAVRAGLAQGCTARPRFEDACAEPEAGAAAGAAAEAAAEAEAAACHDIFIELRQTRGHAQPTPLRTAHAPPHSALPTAHSP